MSDARERRETERLKEMYVDGTVSLEVFEAIMDYYIDEKNESGPTAIGESFPSSVAPNAPPADKPEELPYIKERL